MTLADVFAAQRRLAPYLAATPLLRSNWLSTITGGHVWLKLESLQTTRSFKDRGALNAALNAATNRSSARVLVTASAGNHGQALARAGQLLGLQTIVFTSKTTPDVKKAAIRRYGADLRDTSPDYDHAERGAVAFAAAAGHLYISPYNHRDVIAGAGTMALEILERVPDIDAVIVPLGGGGLAAGVGMVLKAAAPRVSVTGVEVAASAPFAASIAHGQITRINMQPSLADGLIGNLEPGSITFDLVRRYVDRLITISESELLAAMRGLACEDRLIAEGAGAAATGAVLAGLIVREGQKVVVIVSGANIDRDRLIAVLAG